MNLQNWISKYFYLLLTIIIIGIIIYVWNTNIYEGAISNISPVSSKRSPSSNSYSSTPSSDDPRIKIDTSQDVNKNKLYADQLYTTTLDQSIQNIDDDIKAVQNMINDINSKIPRTGTDIRAGNVSQTDNPNLVSINIRNVPYKITDPINPSNGEILVGQWYIDAILPRGQKGETGLQGLPGPPGDKGDTGNMGPRGLRGKWGKST